MSSLMAVAAPSLSFIEILVVEVKCNLTLKRLGIKLTRPPCGFSKNVLSRERVKP